MNLLNEFDCQEVVQRVWICDYQSAQCLQELHERNITHIISAMGEISQDYAKVFEGRISPFLGVSLLCRFFSYDPACLWFVVGGLVESFSYLYKLHWRGQISRWCVNIQFFWGFAFCHHCTCIFDEKKALEPHGRTGVAQQRQIGWTAPKLFKSAAIVGRHESPASCRVLGSKICSF